MILPARNGVGLITNLGRERPTEEMAKAKAAGV